MCFEREMKSKIKIKSEQLFEPVTLEIHGLWRTQYFFGAATIQQYANSRTSNIGTVDVN